MPAQKKFRFYFSFRSPFAGIAFYRLRRSALFNDYEIELIPVWPEIIFGGHMDNPTDNLFKVAYVFVDAARQAEEAGLASDYLKAIASRIELPKDVDFSKEKLGLKLPPEDWRVPHHAFLYAQSQGLGWEFGDAIFAHRFNFDGHGPKNVMDPDVLAETAVEVGLDADAMKQALASGQFADVEAAVVRKSEADGVFGVPFFAIDQPDRPEVFWGNDHLGFLYKSLTGGATLPHITADSLNQVQARQ